MTSNFEVSSTTSSPSLFTSYISPHGCVSASVNPMKTISCDLLFCRRSEVSTVIITQYCLQAQRPLLGYGNITSASPGRCCSTIGTFCQYWRLYKLVIFGNCDWQCRYGKNGHSVKKTLNWINYSESTLQVQTLGFWALTICPASETSRSIIAPIPTWVKWVKSQKQFPCKACAHCNSACVHPSEYWRPSTTQVTTGLGLLLVVFGIGSKMGAIYGTGYNTYYWWTFFHGDFSKQKDPNCKNWKPID